ncbi:HlyD family efflux transporter periplasmic adaptor subunit [Gloeocapsa sp. BRSZ]
MDTTQQRVKRPTLASSPAQSRQVKQQFANPDEFLSYELGKAVQELPPLYTRLLAGSISLLVFGTIGWAHFSKIDEVAIAPGELIASAQVRPVRALGEGSILAVRVREGDRVNQGDVLVERNSDLPQAEVDRLTRSAQLINEDLKRLEAERTGAAASGTDLQDQLLSSRMQNFEARQAAAIAEANRQAAVINEARVRWSRLQDNLVNARATLANAQQNLVNAQSITEKAKSLLANAEKREASLRTLLEDGAAPRLDYIEAQNAVLQAQAGVTNAEDGITNARSRITEAQDRVVSIEKEITAQAQQVRQAEQAYQAARDQAASLASERQSEILTQLNRRREEQATVQGQLVQAKKQREQEVITAPVSGTIYSIKATSGPVQPGEELLSILPDGEELLLEVRVLNRDIGFIREGMRAKVKLATFPFQEFGTINAEVISVSPNAVNDEKLGLVFPTRLKLEKNSLQVRGQEVQLTPGMAATGEIVTRRKSVLTFLLEPVTRRFSEAFSVR